MTSAPQSHMQLLESVNELRHSCASNVDKPLASLKAYKEHIRSDQLLYYNESQDTHDRKKYYWSFPPLDRSDKRLFYKYHELLNRTHKHRLPYFISKDQLYSWVDLHPDGSVKSIYSGERKDPKQLIEEDFELIKKKYHEFQLLLKNIKHSSDHLEHKMTSIDSAYKLNTEHIVPQSWFGGKEPMKGDLHHLFVCQPECNSIRSNFPYDDFPFYEPESPHEPIQNHCGVTTGDRFEPEDGKGAASRAMLYFLVRYPQAIKKSFIKQINISLLIEWHQQFKVTIYEKHRNQAIFKIQGNRNPFIDFPELAEIIRIPNTRTKT